MFAYLLIILVTFLYLSTILYCSFNGGKGIRKPFKSDIEILSLVEFFFLSIICLIYGE